MLQSIGRLIGLYNVLNVDFLADTRKRANAMVHPLAIRVLQVGFVGLLLLGCARRPTPPQADTGPPMVTVAHPLVEKVTLFTDLTGTVDAREYVDVYPRVSGYIKEIRFKEGSEVTAEATAEDPDKNVLFLIDPTIYEARLGEVQGQLLNYEAQLAKAKADLTRAKETFERGATSKTDYDSAIAAKDVAEAQVYTAKQSVLQARQNLEWCKVRAPINGRVGRAYLTVGNLARADQSLLCTIVSVDPMVAYFDVDEATVRTYMRLIAEGKFSSPREGNQVPAEIQLRGETGYPHKGFLEFVDNRLNPQTGSLTIRGLFANPIIPGTKSSRPLAPGLYCRGRIPLSQPFDGLLIPQEAIITDQGLKAVYVLDSDNRIQMKRVILGPLVNGRQLVQSGLTKDDLVVIRGLSRVMPGIVVQPHQETLSSTPVSPE